MVVFLLRKTLMIMEDFFFSSNSHVQCDCNWIYSVLPHNHRSDLDGLFYFEHEITREKQSSKFWS